MSLGTVLSVFRSQFYVLNIYSLKLDIEEKKFSVWKSVGDKKEVSENEKTGRIYYSLIQLQIRQTY